MHTLAALRERASVRSPVEDVAVTRPAHASGGATDDEAGKRPSAATLSLLGTFGAHKSRVELTPKGGAFSCSPQLRR
jgi:hypothetical protein